MGTASQFRLRVPLEINKIQSRNWRLSPFFSRLLDPFKGSEEQASRGAR